MTRPALPGAARVRRRTHGQSLIEFAISAPIILLIMLGTIDVGRLFFSHVEITNAVREGAGFAAHQPDETAAIELRVNRHVTDLAPDAIAVTCSNANCPAAEAGDHVTVKADWVFEPFTAGFLDTFFGIPEFNLSASSTMKVL